MKTQFNTTGEIEKITFDYSHKNFNEMLNHTIDVINENCKDNIKASFKSNADKQSLILIINRNNSIYVNRDTIQTVCINDATIEIETLQQLKIIVWFIDKTVTIYNKCFYSNFFNTNL